MSEVASEFVDRLLAERMARCPRSMHRFRTDKPFHDAVTIMRNVLTDVVDQCRREGLYARAVERVVRGSLAAMIDDRYIDQEYQRQLTVWLGSQL